MSRALFLFAPFLLALGGCQQAAWKAGASADDFKRDEIACRSTHNDDALVSQCLRDKGWSVANFEAPIDDAEMQTPGNANTPVDQAAPPPLTGNVRNSNDPPIEKKLTASADPLHRQSVQTWWKAGAQAADFQVDAERCLTQLGEQHTPDYAKHLYTRALVQCLRESGWYAGRDPVYTPLR